MLVALGNDKTQTLRIFLESINLKKANTNTNTNTYTKAKKSSSIIINLKKPVCVAAAAGPKGRVRSFSCASMNTTQTDILNTPNTPFGQM